MTDSYYKHYYRGEWWTIPEPELQELIIAFHENRCMAKERRESSVVNNSEVDRYLERCVSLVSLWVEDHGSPISLPAMFEKVNEIEDHNDGN